MSAIIDYIFRHQHYKDVLSSYAKAKEEYNTAYNAWLETLTQPIGDDYKSKVYIHLHIEDIKKIDGWVNIARKLLRESRKALEWFFHIKGIETLPQFHYKEYKLIADNHEAIKTLIVYLHVYNSLIVSEKDAIDRFLNHSTSNHSFEEIKSIATSKAKIQEIGEILKKAHACKSSNHRAWEVFAQGSNIEAIPLDKLKTIDDNSFNSKDMFLSVYYKNPVLCKLIIGEHDISSFKKKDIEDEEDCYFQLLSEQDPITPLEAKVQIEGDELKRAILDSLRYGKDVHFADDFTISDFYDLRGQSDRLEKSFDKIVDKTKSNYDAIKAFNKEESGKEVVYIQDYIPASTEGSQLYNFIESYNQQKELRIKAKRIKENYPLGFSELFGGWLNIDTCAISMVNNIVNAEQRIQQKESEEREKERLRQEAERKRQEEERKAQELNDLMRCVSSWDSLYCGLKYSYLLRYYPTTCEFEATEEEWQDRWTVWNFKNSAGKTSPSSHQSALNTVIPRLKNKLYQTFGTRLSKLTLVCIPASSQENTIRRYEEFARLLCSETGIENSFDKISVVKSKEERRSGGTSIQVGNLWFDSTFFKGRYVILFDDVITRGDSMSTFKMQMQRLGAIVIAGLSVGKTKHERPIQPSASHSSYDDLPF